MKKQEIIMVRGLPASGKSSWAILWVEADPENRVRVNLDDIRYELYQDYVLLLEDGSSDRAKQIKVAEVAMSRVREAIKAGKSVVYDATNLSQRSWRALSEIAEFQRRRGHIVEVRYVDFPVNYYEALARNSKRSDERRVRMSSMKRFRNSLGPEGQFPHLDGTYPLKKIVYPFDREIAVCVDLDGTLVDVRSVRHFVNPSNKIRNFDRFHRHSLWCPPNERVIEQVKAVHDAGFKIVITTAREERYREVSQLWLDRHDIPFENMFMRPLKDQRSDYEVKKEMLFTRVLPHYDPVRFMDDNPQAIQAWEENGFTVSKVPFVGPEDDDAGLILPLSNPPIQSGVCIRCGESVPEGKFISERCSEVVPL